MSARTLTPELKAALCGRLPFSANIPINYVPKAFANDTELPEEYKPVFTLRAFTPHERNEVSGLLSAVSGKDEARLSEITRKCITGWKNLFDAGSGEEIEFKSDPKGGCLREVYDLIPASITGDLFLYISHISGLLPREVMGLK